MEAITGEMNVRITVEVKPSWNEGEEGFYRAIAWREMSPNLKLSVGFGVSRNKFKAAAFALEEAAVGLCNTSEFTITPTAAAE